MLEMPVMSEIGGALKKTTSAKYRCPLYLWVPHLQIQPTWMKIFEKKIKIVSKCKT